MNRIGHPVQVYEEDAKKRMKLHSSYSLPCSGATAPYQLVIQLPFSQNLIEVKVRLKDIH